MKKAEEYFKEVYKTSSEVFDDRDLWDLKSVIKICEQIQKDAIAEAVKRCAEKATYNRSIFENLNYVSIDRQSILKVADELIKGFNLGKS
jgi:predicted ATPase